MATLGLLWLVSPSLVGQGAAEVTANSPAQAGLDFSTFLGGTGVEHNPKILQDAEGNILIVGTTDSADFPTTSGAFETSVKGGRDLFIAKLSADGTHLLFSTLLGGSDADWISDVVVDAEGNVLVAGGTRSPDFPTTPRAFQTTHQGSTDGFVAKLSSDGGTLLFSSFLGGAGDDNATAVARDHDGNVLVAGWTGTPDPLFASPNFPTTPGVFDTTFHGFEGVFVTKFTADGQTLLFSTLLGGTGSEVASSIALDRDGNIVVAGTTGSFDFPTTPGAFDRTFNAVGGARGDVFVTALSADGTALIYSTFLGGKGSQSGTSIVLDREGRAILVGSTTSPEFPLTPQAFDTTLNGAIDVFVTKLVLEPFAFDAPDLTGAITKFKRKINKKGREVLKFNVTIGNTGNLDVQQPLTVMAVLSEDETVTDDALLLKTWTLDRLNTGEVRKLKGKIKDPSLVPDQFLLVVLDAAEEIVEVDETNNVVRRQIPAPPDP